MSQLRLRVIKATKLRLAQLGYFWAARRALQGAGFRAFRQLFSVRHRILESNTGARSLISLVRLTGVQLLKALLLTVLLFAINDLAISVWPTISPKLSPETYTTLLATITAIGGVFIGLYYTAISLVAGTIYARVPNNIRDLLAHERVGNVYMRSLSLLTALGVALLAADAVGSKPLALAVPLFGVWTVFAIFAFVSLGARAFDLFDPTTLSYNLFESLRRNYMQMRVGGYRWRDPTFQNHAHRVAHSALDTVSTLADITEKETHLNGQPYASLAKNLIHFLVQYEDAKKEIPTDSRWYGQKYVHPDWYRTSDSTVSIVHQTATTLEPLSESDPRWIEERVLPVVWRCLVVNLEQQREEMVLEVLSYIDAYVKKLAMEGEVEAALGIVEDAFESCAQHLLPPQEAPQTEEPLTRFGIIDRIAGLAITILLAYRESSEDQSSKLMEQRLTGLDWSRTSAIYKAGFRQQSLKQLEWLQARLSFELEVEGERVSPNWYLHELMRLDCSRFCEEALRNLYSRALTVYMKWIEAANDAKHPWLAAVLITREMEYWNKLEYHEESICACWTEYAEPGRLEGLNWPTINIEQRKQEVAERKQQLLRLMSAEANILLLIERPESHPDFAGQFLHTVGEALITAMYENESEQVQSLFRPYLMASLLLFDRNRPVVDQPDWRQRIDFKVAVAPLIDLMDLSGYAYLYGAYHREESIVQTVADAWNEYLDNTSDEQRPLNILAGAISLTEASLELAHRSVLRSGWQRVAEHRLADLERKEVFRRGGFGLSGDEYVMHDDPLVRVFAAGRYSFYDGIDLFLAKYLRNRPEFESVDFGVVRDRNDMDDAIEREVERFRELEDSNV